MSAPDWKAIGEKLAAELVAHGRNPRAAWLKLKLVEAAILRDQNPALGAEADKLLKELAHKQGGEFPTVAVIAIVQNALKVVRKLERAERAH